MVPVFLFVRREFFGHTIVVHITINYGQNLTAANCGADNNGIIKIIIII